MLVGHKPVSFGVKINQILCVACLNCIEVCANHNFKLSETGKPEVIEPYFCSGCNKCRDGCLTRAIRVSTARYCYKRP